MTPTQKKQKLGYLEGITVEFDALLNTHGAVRYKLHVFNSEFIREVYISADTASTIQDSLQFYLKEKNIPCLPYDLIKVSRQIADKLDEICLSAGTNGIGSIYFKV